MRRIFWLSAVMAVMAAGTAARGAGGGGGGGGGATAQRELATAKPGDRELLARVLAGESDPEVRERVQAEIEALDDQLALDPLPITVEVNGGTADDVAAALSKATGVSFKARAAGSERITVQVKDRPFGEVIKSLGPQVALTGPSVPGLRPVNAQAAVVQGPYVITALGVEQQMMRAVRMGRGGGAPAALATVLSFEVVVDPRVTLVDPPEVKATTILDDKGNEVLGPDAPAQGPRFMRAPGWCTLAAQPLIGGGGMTIVSARGTVHLLVQVRADRMEIPDMEKLDSPITLGGQVISFSQFKIAPTQMSFSLSSTERPGNAGSAGGVAMNLIDADGNAVWSSEIEGNAGLGATLGRGGVARPVKGIFTHATKTQEVVIPFEFKNLAMPLTKAGS